MNWKDDNGEDIKLYDWVRIDGKLHQLLLHKIGKKNKMVFIRQYEPNVLVEYHYMCFKHAKTLGIVKTNPYLQNNITSGSSVGRAPD